jgi:hypothetical protein
MPAGFGQQARLETDTDSLNATAKTLKRIAFHGSLETDP